MVRVKAQVTVNMVNQVDLLQKIRPTGGRHLSKLISYPFPRSNWSKVKKHHICCH